MKRNLKKLTHITAKFALVIFAMIALNACNDDDGQNIQPAEVAYVSLYQASPNAPDLDILVDNRKINSYPFDYTDYTGYKRFYTGDRSFKFGPYNANNVAADTTVTFEENRSYSVFTVDNYDKLKVLVLKDDESDPPAEGQAMVRFLNLSPDTSPLNLNTDIDETAVFSDLGFLEASSFTSIDADDYNFTVTAPDNSQINLDVPDITFQKGWYYTIIVRGYETPPAGNNNVLSAEIIVN